MDDPLLVGVLHGLADLHEQVQPLGDRQAVLVAIVGDRDAADQLHDEVGPAGLGGAGVEHPGDVGVVHQRQRLPLGLEPGDDLLRVHARLDDLQRHLAAHGLGLLGHVDDAHAPFADLLQQLVRADDRAGAFHRLGRRESHGRPRGGRVQEATHLGLGFEQPLDPPAQVRVRATNVVEISGPGLGRLPLHGGEEDLVDTGRWAAHRRDPRHVRTSGRCSL